MKKIENHLIHFYGSECPHCDRVRPILDAFEKETGISVERLEVWHDKENEDFLVECDKGEGDDKCGGVPFFVNTKTGKTICGETTVKELKDWAE